MDVNSWPPAAQTGEEQNDELSLRSLEQKSAQGQYDLEQSTSPELRPTDQGKGSSLRSLAEGQAAAKTLQPQECHQIEFSRNLLWVTSGAWTPNGEALLVADVLSEKILAISPSGDLLSGFGAFESSTGVSAELDRPSFIHSNVQSRFFVEDEGPDLIYKLDSSLFVEAQTSVKHPSKKVENDGTRLIAVYGWQPMNEGFLAFGDVRYENVKGPDQYKSSFLHFDEKGIRRFYGRPMGTFNEVRNHYLRNMPYLVTLDGENGYILNMEEVPSIQKVGINEDGVQELEFFPEDFRTTPRLVRRPGWTRTLQGARQATAFYEKWEASTMAAGLYGWNNHLYLLAKEAMTDKGETAWWLINLDPRDGREISRARLPTAAAHLTIVPGERFALIEKDPVVGIGDHHAPYMETSSMVLVAATWLEQPADSPLAGEARLECISLRSFSE